MFPAENPKTFCAVFRRRSRPLISWNFGSQLNALIRVTRSLLRRMVIISGSCRTANVLQSIFHAKNAQQYGDLLMLNCRLVEPSASGSDIRLGDFCDPSAPLRRFP